MNIALTSQVYLNQTGNKIEGLESDINSFTVLSYDLSSSNLGSEITSNYVSIPVENSSYL